MRKPEETELYAPVKQFLTAQGYEVKGEVNGCDVVAVCGDDLVVVELKLQFNLDLVFQGMQRQRVTDWVYLAVAAPRKLTGTRWSQVQQLCRRLGFGLMAVHLATGRVEVLADPGPYTPRRSPAGRTRLLREFQQREGDHNTGGSTRRPIVTAYREEALRIAACLRREGTAPVAGVRAATGSARAAAILQRNVYRWFERVGRGRYALTPAGVRALEQYADVVAALAKGD